MTSENSHPISKRELWDHVAREFDYSCPSCWRRPDLEDCESFLVTGYCRACRQPEPPAGQSTDSEVPPVRMM